MQYWNSCRAGRKMPTRADISPWDIPRLLPNIGLIDVVETPARFRFRLLGSEIDRLFGESLSNVYLDALPATQYGNRMVELYRQCVDWKQIVINQGLYRRGDMPAVELDQLLLPLSGGAAVNIILTLIDFRAPDTQDQVNLPKAAAGERIDFANSNETFISLNDSAVNALLDPN